ARSAESDRHEIGERHLRARARGDRDRRDRQSHVEGRHDAERHRHRARQVAPGHRNSPASWAIDSQPMKSHTRMLAALPIAHQPCGANGAQLSLPRLGSGYPTAVAITQTRNAEVTRWNQSVTRRTL